MTLGEMISYAARKTGLDNSGQINKSTRDFAVTAVNRAALEVWRAFPWTGAKLARITVTTDEPIVVFPKNLECVMSINLRDGRILQNRSEQWLSTVEPSMLALGSSIGTPEFYRHLPDCAISRPQRRGSRLIISCQDPRDIGKSVTVEGLNGNTPCVGRMVMSELGGEWLKANIDTIVGISKELTSAVVRIEDEDQVLLTELLPGETSCSYRRIELMPAPLEMTVLDVCGKRRLYPMVGDGDCFPLAHVEDAVLDLLVAELYEYQQRVDLSQVFRGLAMDKVKSAVAQENSIQGQNTMLVPGSPCLSGDYYAGGSW